MSFLDRLRRRVKTVTRPRLAPLEDRTGPRVRQVDTGAEGALRERLAADPNDAISFAELAEIVRRHAAEGHGPGAPSSDTPEARARAADDADSGGWASSPSRSAARKDDTSADETEDSDDTLPRWSR